ncbi:hypothetical protein QUF90_27325 [Desulfococcaceae bacterium HSG9]|nr:hypothetical protein [Desulfococcaceae bacterium HSG9]
MSKEYERKHITMQMHSDKIKLLRFTLHLYFAGDLRRSTRLVHKIVY